MKTTAAYDFKESCKAYTAHSILNEVWHNKKFYNILSNEQIFSA